MTIEIYKDVVGYEGIYHVSNLGNVKRVSNFKSVNKKYIHNHILIVSIKKGYHYIRLTNNNKTKSYLVHRLVAMAFIDNPNNYNFVNHINGIKSDNNLENLEWCTHSQNIRHAIKIGLKPTPKGDDNKLSRKIIDTETGEIYHSTLTLSIKLGVNRGTLWAWLSNKRPNKTSFKWL
jgi:hypothetical protein